MEIQLIGHASIFVKTQDCQILMDPVLWDPHQEGVCDIYPTRQVIHEKIPDIDLLILSHQHLDHFQIRSLAYLPKSVDVLIPEDKLLEECLRQLGYSHIYTLKDFDKVKFGETSLLATRSENRVPEYGVIFADASGVFWNQVDTEVSLNTIRLIQNRYDRIDFLLALWQPMLEMNYQMNMSLAFPYSMYGKILKSLSLIQPRAVAPGSNGFKCIGGSAWMNQILFPVTRERFCQDVKAVCPDIGNNVFALDPGDILTIDNGEFKQLQGKCEFVTKGHNDSGEIDFSPVNIGNQLVDPNTDNYPLDDMSLSIEEEIGIKLPEFITKHRDLLFIEHCHWQVIYQLAIVFPNGTRTWSFDFTQPNIEAKVGRNPLANLFTYMTASSLYALLKRLKGMDYANLGGYYRRFQKLYIATPHGIIEPDPEERISDPLAMRLPYNEIFKEMLQQEIARWSHLKADRADEPDVSRTLMMRMGNTLVKLNR